MEKVNAFDGSVQFYSSNELEMYRINSVYDKEPETIAWIDSWSSDEQQVFFDIGANIGIYSLYASFRHHNLKVFAFEPVKNNFQSLSLNVDANQNLNVFPFNLALSNENRVGDLFLNDIRVGNSGAQINQAKDENGKDFLPLKVEKTMIFSLDYLVEEFGFEAPNFVKIDVDGQEDKIISGMNKILSLSTTKSILIEINKNAEFSNLENYLREFSFFIDTTFDNIENHSSIRRSKKGNEMRNFIFSRR